jgi:hypothetical protein
MVPEATESSAPVEGDLGLGTFPALLRRLHEERATGVLRIAADGAERRVYFKWGFVIFASSEHVHDRLDQRLLSEGMVSSTTLLIAYDEQKSSGARFGKCLVEMGALSEDQLLGAVERQVRSIIHFLFSLSRGHFRFDPAEDPVDEDLMLDLPIQQILLEGIRSIKDPLALRIGVGSMTDVLHANPDRGENLPALNASEAYVLSRADSRMTILELLSLSPLGDAETLRSVCALLAVGIVSAKPGAQATRGRSAPR